MFQEGQIFGEFEILGGLGNRGLASAFKARHVAMDRFVTINALRGSPATAPEVIARFSSGAQIAISLEHPDLVRVFSAGETDGVHWVSMEFVEGTDAQARLKRKGRL